MHYTTALNVSKKKMTPTIGLKLFYACAVIVTSKCQNHFADVVLFLAGGDRVGYFLDRPRILVQPALSIGLLCEQ